jgi:hypothetical protein
MHSGRAQTVVAALAASLLFAGCNRSADIEKVPVGSNVQLTRDDGGVVEGTLAARDTEIVKVKSDVGLRAVPRDEIAVVQVVRPGQPVKLPRMAKFREYVVPNGTTIALNLDTPVSSETSRVGESVQATLTAPVRVNGIDVLPAGSVVHGKVTVAKRAGNVKGRAQLAMHFDAVVVNNERYPNRRGTGRTGQEHQRQGRRHHRVSRSRRCDHWRPDRRQEGRGGRRRDRRRRGDRSGPVHARQTCAVWSRDGHARAFVSACSGARAGRGGELEPFLFQILSNRLRS